MRLAALLAALASSSSIPRSAAKTGCSHSPTAVKMRKDAGDESLNDADLKWHDDHRIGTYAKIANTGFHAVVMTLQGTNGSWKEVPPH